MLHTVAHCRWLVVSRGATALHVAAQQQHASVVLAIMQQHALSLRDWLPVEGSSRRPVDPRTWWVCSRCKQLVGFLLSGTTC